MFELAHPWMLALLPLPLLIHRFAPAYRQRQDAIRVPFFRRLIALTGQQPGSGAIIHERLLFQKIWLPLSWLLLVVALADPLWLGAPIEQTKSARDLMVAVDLSGSMAARDFRLPNHQPLDRLGAVKQVLRQFAERRAHDRLGLIVFGDAPYLQVPFTEDHRLWRTLLDETAIGMAGQSTVFGDAIGLAIRQFEQSKTKHRVLIMLTDGNDTGSTMPPIEAAKIAAARGVKIYIIAVGDPATVGEEALDLETMQRVASITHGGLYQALNRDDLVRAAATIEQLEPVTFERLAFQPKRRLFHYPLAIILCGYLLFFLRMALRLRTEQRA